MSVWGPGYPKYKRGRPVRRKRTVKSVKASCDKLWSRVVRVGGECERCGATSEERQLHAHHIHGRSNHRLRFLPENGVCLCAACHYFFHENPLLFAKWFDEHRPGAAEVLEREHQKGLVKRNLEDYLKLERDLQNRLGKKAA